MVFLHGGPGAGASAVHRQFFDPAFYRIVVLDQRGAGRSTPLGCLEDNTTPKLVDADYFGGFGPTQLGQTWAPDSKWIAYDKLLPSGLHAVFVYSLEQSKPAQITDGMSDTLYPSFDKNGKYLYFTASTDTGLTPAGLDMSSDE